MERGAWDAEAERRGLIRRIKTRMSALDMTNAQLAKQLGISPAHVRDVLNLDSGTWLGGATLIRCPRVLRCSYHWLFTGEGMATDTERPPTQQVMDAYAQAYADIEMCLSSLRQRLPTRRATGPAQ